jgi:hypothetical protein
VLLSDEGEYRLVHSGDVKVYENLGDARRARVYHDVIAVADDAEAVDAMRGESFRPIDTLVLHGDCESTGHDSEKDSAWITVYEPERVVVEAELESPGYLFLADAYYPGWVATVDGERVEVIRADVMFRAVRLDAGTHTVEFTFAPESARWGFIVGGVGLLIALGLAVFTTTSNR